MDILEALMPQKQQSLECVDPEKHIKKIKAMKFDNADEHHNLTKKGYSQQELNSIAILKPLKKAHHKVDSSDKEE
eukprot:15366949-Ditylum_brightwellii.AAC.1